MSESSIRSSNSQTKLVDIEKVFSEKNPRLLKWIPRFVLGYVKRLIHQETINRIVRDHGHEKGIAFARAGLKECMAEVTQQGLEQIPEGKRYLFASNHPLGGLDGVALISVVGEKFPDLKFPVNDILLHLEPLNNIFIPVNKLGAQSKEKVSLFDQAFASDSQILFFPAGLVSRKINGKVTDLQWKSSFVKKAIANQRDIVPVYVSGRNSNFFYNLARFRKFIGLKINIEMVFLPDELFRAKTKKIVIKFGTPIPWQSLQDGRSLNEWVDIIRQKSYEMA
jgi:1-acyl-sn-glycerol-3-phosphate acyltransferase